MARTNIFGVFAIILIMQLFFSIGITLYIHALPSPSLVYVEQFQLVSQRIDAEEVGSRLEDNINSQRRAPLTDVGALVFYSGNLIIDLILNFFFAIPEMIGLLIFGLQYLLQFPSYLIGQIQLFAASAMIIIYVLSVLELLTGLRTGRIT